MLYTLNMYYFICPLYLNKAGKNRVAKVFITKGMKEVPATLRMKAIGHTGVPRHSQLEHKSLCKPCV